MRLVFLQSVFVLLFVVSCSGPQMISTPQPESENVSIKKNESNSKQVENKIELAEDQGVFDDENHRLKANVNQWKLIDDQDGIKTYEKKNPNSDLVAFRGEILIPAPLKKIATILQDEALQKEWIDSFVESKIIREVSEYERVGYNQIKVPWPCQNRDFVFRVNAKVNVQPPTMLISMKSIETESIPPVSGIVRGNIVDSYYYLKESNGLRATKVAVEMEVDPKGAIPLWLVNTSQKKWPHNTLSALKKISMREDIRVLPKIEKYFEEVKIKAKVKTKGKNKK